MRTSLGLQCLLLSLTWLAIPGRGQQPPHAHPPKTPPAKTSTPGSHNDHAGHGAMPDDSGLHHAMPAMSGMDHSTMDHDTINTAGMFLFGQSSGTGYQPAVWPMPMVMTRAGGWNLMWMGQAYLIETQQSGPRGGDKFYSVNWGMLGGVRKAGRGSVMLRAMVSLDPATVTHRRYPLLFQTGENAFAKPIVDAQHPHEFLMELSAQYARPIGEKGMFNLYYAPVGDPALGPVAYPHRASALEIPQAALGHHWQDATHIANNVVTGGFSWSRIRLEASGFRGRSPNEARWNIDMGAMDSWSGRLSVFPTRRWMAQASMGRLKAPELMHPDDVVRSTASVHYVVPRAGSNYWASSIIWGRNYHTIAKHASHALLAETVVPLGRKNFLTGRFEWSQRDELFAYDHDLAHHVEEQTGKHAFGVVSYTAGYTRDVALFRNVQTGIGANFTAYQIDRDLRPFYGNHPFGVSVFLRVRLRGEGQMSAGQR